MLFLLIGKIYLTQKNKKVHVRKRLLHKGYQISKVTYDFTLGEEHYELLEEYDTMELVNDYLRRN